MSDERWQRVEDLFHRAIDLAPAERSRFLAGACAGDDELLREVESLLAHDAANEDVVGAAVDQAVERLPERSVGELVGKHVGAYVLTELIGKGGMGMVFKARDTRLNRLVAIKALSPDYFADPERKRRFLQEAKSASALNHPNIVTVHDIGEEDGSDFLIMEYVSGKTLDRLIPRKGLPLKQALQYSLEIADALTAAHAAGIVHRDIKPSNIMVTDLGRIKILDFGLAKRTEPADAGRQPARATVSMQTEPGKMIGTVEYMSPEQAEGKAADERSDIFSFGVLLYEMVTGKRAFQGKNIITILSTVINQEPPPPRSLAASVPRELEWLIIRCLKKDRDRRVHHIIDVKLALQELLERIDALAEPVVRVPGRRYWVAALIALALGLTLGAWLGQRIFRGVPITYQRLTFRRGDLSAARFAPGGTVVYTAAWDGAPPALFSAMPGNREARDLGLPPATIFAVSSSGEMAIGFESANLSTLARAPLAGGAPRRVLENVSSADWAPDGESLAVVRTSDRRYRIEYPIGTVLYETQIGPPLWLRVSPRGDRLTFFDFTQGGDYSLTVVDAARRRRVLSRGWRAIGGLGWAPGGGEIWFSALRVGGDSALWAVDLSGRERLLMQIPGFGLLADVSRDGSILLAEVNSRIGIRCLAPRAQEERDLGWQDTSSVSDISSDGREILFTELSDGKGRNPSIYLRRTDGSAAVKLGYGSTPALSPDGNWVLCMRREGEKSIPLLLPTGAGEAKALSTGAILPDSVEWFPDGKRILITGNESGKPSRTYASDLATGDIRPVTPVGVRAGRISPDGRVAIVRNAGKLFFHSLDNDRQWPVRSTDPADSAIRWSGDGQHLFLQHTQPGQRAVTILRFDMQTGHSTNWHILKVPEAGANFRRQARLSADGKSYAFSFQQDVTTLYLVKGVR
jgi:serine/threonine protein kinase/Tol biopolymer transport system component